MFINNTPSVSSSRHHEHSKANHKRTAAPVKSLDEVMTDLENPIEEESADLPRLHSRDIMDKASVECLTTIKCRGEDQYRLFVSERLRDRSKPLTVTISRNKVRIFNEQPQRKKTKSQEMATLLKSEASLFARLYVDCETKDGDMDNFFSHENQPFPPSLSSFGQLANNI